MSIMSYQKGLVELGKTCHGMISGSVKGGGRENRGWMGKEQMRENRKEGR